VRSGIDGLGWDDIEGRSFVAALLWMPAKRICEIELIVAALRARRI
jgi:hypothetical protein